MINLIEKRAKLSKDLTSLEVEVNRGEESMYFKNISNYLFSELKKRLDKPSTPIESSPNMKLVSSRYIKEIIDYFNIIKKSFELFMSEYDAFLNTDHNTNRQYFHSHSLVEFKLVIEDLLNDLLLPASLNATTSRLDNSMVVLIRAVLFSEKKVVDISAEDVVNPELKDPRLLVSSRKSNNDINLQAVDFQTVTESPMVRANKEPPFNEKYYKKSKYKLVKDLEPCKKYSELPGESKQPMESTGIIELDTECGEISFDLEEGEVVKKSDPLSSSVSSDLVDLNGSQPSILSNKSVLNITKQIPIENMEEAVEINANNSWFLSMTASSISSSPPKTPVYHPSAVTHVNMRICESSTPNGGSVVIPSEEMSNSSILKANSNIQENESELSPSASFSLVEPVFKNDTLKLDESVIELVDHDDFSEIKKQIIEPMLDKIEHDLASLKDSQDKLVIAESSDEEMRLVDQKSTSMEE
jgi:hypothetical protein